MAILCGTDFTEAAAQAEQVAARLAVRLSVPLHLVHVVPRGEAGAPAGEEAGSRLRVQAGLLAYLGADVRVSVREGTPDAVLAGMAQEVRADLAVVGAGRERGILGGTADRLVQRGTVPVLVLRPGAPLEAWMAWLREGTPLRVLVASDLTRSSDAALEWVGRLRKAGPCRLTVVHLYDPGRVAKRVGLAEGGEGTALDVERSVRLDLEARVRRLAGEEASCVIRAVAEDPAGALLAHAYREEADLLVAGTRRRHGLARAWRVSVSAALLADAGMPVAVVPASAVPAGEVPVPPADRVLVATDLSEAGNAAVPHGYSMVPRGGRVYLLHVLDLPEPPMTVYAHFTPASGPTRAEREKARAATAAALRALVPADAESLGIRTRVLVLEGRAAEVIVQAAELHAVDAVCVGSRGRSALAKAVLGSVASSVLARSRRPVLVVPPDRET